MSGNTLTAGAGYTTFTGYFKGTGSTNSGNLHSAESVPGWMYTGVAYIRPAFVLSFSAGNGIADIQTEILEVDK